MLTMVWPSKWSSTIAPSNRLLFEVRCANSNRIATPAASGSRVAMPSSHGPSSRSRSAIFPANTSFQQGRWWPLASAISRKTSVDGHNLMGTTITAVGTSAVAPPAPTCNLSWTGSESWAFREHAPVLPLLGTERAVWLRRDGLRFRLVISKNRPNH